MTKRLLFIALTLVGLNSQGQHAIDSSRQILSISATKDGTIEWMSNGESNKEPFVIEQFRWNKWIKIGEVDPHVSSGIKTYQFKAIPHNGENLCRVKPTSASTDVQEVKWTNSEFPIIEFTYSKQAARIEFHDSKNRSMATMYEIIDESGKTVKKGWSEIADISTLPKGNYTLNYDTKIATIKL